ncbi:ATP-binding protein [Geomonas sp. RF6]|uniref:ATP-binding protein n=1 Tax=Geomonas sp. RF6 TaxID=2897342 RepID=UPI001E466D25|nr:ATP-binding protein [Geomonas sp. RF6]UFS68942.1 ATP-binding protein [Geomonas sp. RF6]
MKMAENRRVLVIDDTPAIHEDFRRILAPVAKVTELDELEAELFDEEIEELPGGFEMESAYQGQEGLAKVQARLQEGSPYAVAFVDVRMPPGWDGVETVERIWEVDPRIQIVICTAYSDYSWRELSKRLEIRDRLLILKKPFDAMEVYQLANALTSKWELSRQAELKVESLEEGVSARTAELAAANQALQARTAELAATNDALEGRTRQLALANKALTVDIARRQAAEEEALNARQRVEDIVEFLPDPTFVVDKEKRVIAWNRALEELTGVGKEEMLGRGDHAYAVPFYGVTRMLLIDMLQDGGKLDTFYSGVDRKGQTICTEVKLVLGGKERLVWSAAAPFFDLHGELVGGIQTMREITELRRSEQERSKLEARLEHANLVQSLVVKLNHDLRTPITPLFALLPIVKERTHDDALKRMLEVCEKSAEQILALTTNSTALVRPRGRRGELTAVPLAAVARERLQKNAGLFTQLGVECDCSGISEELAVLGALDQLSLLFDNLLSNAARYARRNGKVRIWVLNAAGMVTVAVQDDGAGLAPEECEKIFHEADPTRESKSGEGLGLSLCKRIVLNHEGSIWAESPGPDQGTTIYFTLKEARQESPEEAPPSAVP